MADVLSTVTGLEIEHWLSIDFTGFREMVDAVGGSRSTIRWPSATRRTSSSILPGTGRGSFQPGEIHLDGAQALAYSRARYTSEVAESTDFARSVRQARVLSALRSSVSDGGAGAIPPGLGLMDAMEGRVRTDVSAIDLFLLSSHMNSDRRVELSEGPVLTATTNTDGQYILIPTGWVGPGDYASIHQYLSGELASASMAPLPPMRRRRRIRVADLPRLLIGGAVGLAGLFGGRYGRVEGANVLVTDADGRILVVRPTYTREWMLPGGRVERGETPHAAAIRETREETGLDVALDRLVLVDARYPRDTSFIFAGPRDRRGARAAARRDRRGGLARSRRDRSDVAGTGSAARACGRGVPYLGLG